MEVRQYLRPDVMVSALVHLSLVAFVVIYTEVRPFHSAVEKVVPVDVVVADEAKKPDPLPTPQPSPDFSQLAKPEAPTPSSSPAVSPPAATPPPPTQAPVPKRREALAQPQPQAAAPTPPAPASPAAPSYAPPQPDLTVKYHVMLGLPEALAPAAASGAQPGEGGDATPATSNLASSLVEPLRRHLKTCSKLPAVLSPSDNVAVKLRVQMTPDGRLAAEPALIEGSASMKGVELMRGAIAALAACQPYAMLPADRYGEWKVLDLSFTPHDFN
jgi:outer membrane biosynthesis protein TonB